MFIPRSFQATDDGWLRQSIEASHFGTVVYRAPDAELDAIPVPFLPRLDREGLGGVLHFHVARAHGLGRALSQDDRVLFIIPGPNSYVSPSLYPSKLIDGRVVPTWNYVAIHVHGKARTVDDASWLLDHVAVMTDRHERTRNIPWRVDDAPEGYLEGLLKAAVGVEIRITAVNGIIKGSQNKPLEDRLAIAKSLASTQCPQAATLATFAANPMLGKAAASGRRALTANGDSPGALAQDE